MGKNIKQITNNPRKIQKGFLKDNAYGIFDCKNSNLWEKAVANYQEFHESDGTIEFKNVLRRF